MNASPMIEDIFAAVPLFRRLSGRQRSRLARHATIRTYQPGDIVIREGDTGNHDGRAAAARGPSAA